VFLEKFVELIEADLMLTQQELPNHPMMRYEVSGSSICIAIHVWNIYYFRLVSWHYIVSIDLVSFRWVNCIYTNKERSVFYEGLLRSWSFQACKEFFFNRKKDMHVGTTSWNMRIFYCRI